MGVLCCVMEVNRGLVDIQDGIKEIEAQNNRLDTVHKNHEKIEGESHPLPPCKTHPAYVCLCSWRGSRGEGFLVCALVRNVSLELRNVSLELRNVSY